MNLVIVIIKTIFFYVFTLIILRIMGKREVRGLNVEDLVVSILIAELCAISIENYNESILLTIIPILILIFFEILSSYLSLKFNRFKHIIDGKPSLIINRGIINYKEMIKERYSLDDLLLELRNNNIKSLEDVEYAILENNGTLSIFKYEFLDKSSNLPLPLILDGKIQYDTLDYINKKESWLLNYLSNRKVNLDKVFYAFYRGDKVYIIMKDELNI